MKLRWSETALHELDDIFSYVFEQNRTAAAAVAKRIRERAMLLEEFPWAGHKTDFGGVRALSVVRYPFVIFYVIDEDANEVSVVSVRHTSRDDLRDND
jgi:addiction module RelE/StbE family toxin